MNCLADLLSNLLIRFNEYAGFFSSENLFTSENLLPDVYNILKNMLDNFTAAILAALK